MNACDPSVRPFPDPKTAADLSAYFGGRVVRERLFDRVTVREVRTDGSAPGVFPAAPDAVCSPESPSAEGCFLDPATAEFLRRTVCEVLRAAAEQSAPPSLPGSASAYLPAGSAAAELPAECPAVPEPSPEESEEAAELEAVLARRGIGEREQARVLSARPRKEKGQGSFFAKLYRQFVVTMGAMILLFCCNLLPAARAVTDGVREAVRTDYTEDVLAVFGES